jgi:hypothetical protein
MDFFQISSRNILAAETVRTDVHAPYFGAELAAHSLSPVPTPVSPRPVSRTGSVSP